MPPFVSIDGVYVFCNYNFKYKSYLKSMDIKATFPFPEGMDSQNKLSMPSF